MRADLQSHLGKGIGSVQGEIAAIKAEQERLEGLGRSSAAEQRRVDDQGAHEQVGGGGAPYSLGHIHGVAPLLIHSFCRNRDARASASFRNFRKVVSSVVAVIEFDELLP